MNVFELKSINLTNLGGPMGSESISTNWRKHFDDIDKAKDAAVKDYKKPIKWKKFKGGFTSGDLGYVEYNINQLQIK